MSFYTLGPLIGPSVGPVAGGFIAMNIGYKWIFIVIAICALVGGMFGLPFLEETYAPVLQKRRAQAEVNADPEKRTFDHDVLLLQEHDLKHVLWVNLTRPFALLFGSFICFILSVYMGL
jgi:MFS family permease